MTEVVPDERVTWRVLDNTFSFVQDQAEWDDTEVRFEISRGVDKWLWFVEAHQQEEAGLAGR